VLAGLPPRRKGFSTAILTGRGRERFPYYYSRTVASTEGWSYAIAACASCIVRRRGKVFSSEHRLTLRRGVGMDKNVDWKGMGGDGPCFQDTTDEGRIRKATDSSSFGGELGRKE